MLTALAPAKVNLFLHVGPVKPNRRHDLESLVVFADEQAADRVSVETSDLLTLRVSGPYAKHAALCADADNLAMRAAKALRAAAGVSQGAAIMLDKSLPIAAGIGGGSADAAATLRLLTQLWGISEDHAVAIAPELGGDVPVALTNQPALMLGEGERVIRAPLLAPISALLVNPGISCPTGQVFAAFDQAGGGKGFTETGTVPWLANTTALIDWLMAQRNDLEGPAITYAPQIVRVLDALGALPRARLARMSGSGATCFALFDTPEDANDAARHLLSKHPNWWARATQLGAGS
jgi:4-diphosphocytidyl-2-C-methyl-D-erythritol kinase